MDICVCNIRLRFTTQIVAFVKRVTESVPVSKLCFLIVIFQAVSRNGCVFVKYLSPQLRASLCPYGFNTRRYVWGFSMIRDRYLLSHGHMHVYYTYCFPSELDNHSLQQQSSTKNSLWSFQNSFQNRMKLWRDVSVEAIKYHTRKSFFPLLWTTGQMAGIQQQLICVSNHKTAICAPCSTYGFFVFFRGLCTLSREKNALGICFVCRVFRSVTR